MDDAQMLLRWKNDPLTIKNSIVTDKLITMKNHLRWLRKNLDGIFIIIVDNTPVGDVRISGGEIAIKLDIKYRGRGLGTEAIRLASKGKKLTAKIVKHNIPSMRVFIQNGYLPVSLRREGTVEYYVFTN